MIQIVVITASRKKSTPGIVILLPVTWFQYYKVCLKVEDTLGKKKTSQWIFLNFIYIVLWDGNKISKFENKFPGLFLKYSLKELPPSEVQKQFIVFTSPCH
jgi:hypothetical protein